MYVWPNFMSHFLTKYDYFMEISNNCLDKLKLPGIFARLGIFWVQNRS